MSRWWLRAAGSVAVVTILLVFVPAGVIWTAVQQVHPAVWLATVAIFIAGHAMNALKLRVLVGTQAASAGACLRAHFTAIATNLGLPGVAGGDLVRVAYLAPTAGTARVALAAVADRLVDGLVLIAIVVTAARLAGVPSVLTVAGVPAGLGWALAAAAIVGGLALWRWRRRRVSDDGAAARTATGLADAWRDLRRRPHAFVMAACVSLAVQSAFVLTNVWLASHVGLVMPVAPWFLAWTAAKLSAVLPISLGGIGVREATLVSVLAAYGAPADAVLATGILWQAAIIAGSLTGFLVMQAMRR